MCIINLTSSFRNLAEELKKDTLKVGSFYLVRYDDVEENAQLIILKYMGQGLLLDDKKQNLLDYIEPELVDVIEII